MLNGVVYVVSYNDWIRYMGIIDGFGPKYVAFHRFENDSRVFSKFDVYPYTTYATMCKIGDSYHEYRVEDANE